MERAKGNAVVDAICTVPITHRDNVRGIYETQSNSAYRASVAVGLCNRRSERGIAERTHLGSQASATDYVVIPFSFVSRLAEFHSEQLAHVGYFIRPLGNIKVYN